MSSVDLRAGEWQRKVMRGVIGRAKVRFQAERCPATFDDLVQEALAVSWRSWTQRIRRGQDPTPHIGLIVRWAVATVSKGQRITHSRPNFDPFNARSRFVRTHGLPRSIDHGLGDDGGPTLKDTLADDYAPPWQHIQARLDWGTFLDRVTLRERDLLERCMCGEPLAAIAHRQGITLERAATLRSELKRRYLDWCK